MTDLYDEPRREPIFNIPGSVAALCAVLVGIHLIRTQLLSFQTDVLMLYRFAFVPARYTGELVYPGGPGADVWTFLTYAFLHGGSTHLIINVLWLVAFGTAVARRLGTASFLALSAASAIGGAALHLFAHLGSEVPVVGASAAIAGLTAAATRFVFEAGAPLGGFMRGDRASYMRPAQSILGTLSNYRAMAFVAVWFGINLVIGLAPLAGIAAGATIAWEAHIGGFLIGFFLFPLFDPVTSAPRRR
jgi:membrane associated rhomboid family serine protease